MQHYDPRSQNISLATGVLGYSAPQAPETLMRRINTACAGIETEVSGIYSSVAELAGTPVGVSKNEPQNGMGSLSGLLEFLERMQAVTSEIRARLTTLV